MNNLNELIAMCKTDDLFDANKFAELVIKECIDICESGTSTQMTSGGAADYIRLRFGFKG